MDPLRHRRELMGKLILMTFPLFVYFTEVLVDHNLGDKEVLEALTRLLHTALAVSLMYEVIIW